MVEPRPRTTASRRCVVSATAAALIAAAVLTGAPVAARSDATVQGERPGATSRFVPRAAILDRPATWVASDGESVAYGDGFDLTVSDRQGVVRRSRTLAFRVVDAVVAGDSLYAIDGGGRVRRVDLAAPSLIAETIPIDVDPGPVHAVALLDDHLVLAGSAITIAALPLGHGDHRPSAASRRLSTVARVPVDGTIVAVATSAGTIHVATDDGRLVRIDAATRDAPSIVDESVVPFRAIDLAANGDRLYALDRHGVWVIERTIDDRSRAPVPQGPHGEVRGTAITVSGRTLRIASGPTGLVEVTDGSPLAAVHDVTVGSNFFSPATLTIEAGDTVRWSNTGGIHNTESCDGIDDSPACGGIAREHWRNGDPAGGAWTFERTFLLVGTNPYFCFQHRFFGMDGTIVVEAPAGPPPGVGDGRAGNGTPMTVARNDASATSLDVSWDTGLCPEAVDYEILYGGSSTIPDAPGGTYSFLGSSCAIGTVSPYTWNPSPDPSIDPGGLVWWIVVATDGAGVEGSLGKDGALAERTGPGTAGSSAECGVSDKDLSNTCGQP